MGYLLAQLSDTHVLEPGRLLDDTVDTARHLADAVRQVNEMRPDLVLVTGDLVDAGRPAQYAHLRELLAPLRAPVVLVPGNHDHRDNLLAQFPELAPRHRRGRLDGVREGPVRLVWLDSLRHGDPGGHLDSDQLEWLDATLAEAPRQPTLVAVHHPPFRTGIGHMDAMGMRTPDADAFGDVVARHAQVERVVCGHLHRSITRRWCGTVAMTVPSSCHAVALDLEPDARGAWILEPPMVTLHRWSEAEGLVTHLRVIGAFESHEFA